MKFAMMVLALVLFSCYHCLFPLTALAQTSNTPESCGAKDFMCRARLSAPTDASQDATIQWLAGQVSALERKISAARAGDVNRDEVRDLQRQLKALEDKVKALSDDLEAHKSASPTTGPSPPAPDPSAALRDTRQDQRLDGIDTSLSDHEGRLNRMADNISGLTKRLQGVENQLRRRAIRFDAGGFGLWSRGYMAAGGLGAITWPLGQDGDWAIRGGLGAGQGWSDNLHSVAWLAKADLLYRWESAALGLTGTIVGGTVRDGNRYLSWDGGLTGRVEPASWLFLQASAVSGAAMGTDAPLQPVPIAGMVETGLTF